MLTVVMISPRLCIKLQLSHWNRDIILIYELSKFDCDKKLLGIF